MDDTTNHDTIGLSADDHAAKADSDVQKSCHYSDAFHNGDTVKPAFAVRMKSKGASPRWRHVCVDCCHWLEGQSLLDQYQELDSQPAMESEAATLPSSRSVGIPRKERETFQGVQSASSASSSTMGSEAATLRSKVRRVGKEYVR